VVEERVIFVPAVGGGGPGGSFATSPGGDGTSGGGATVTINSATVYPQVTISLIILDSTGNIDAPNTAIGSGEDNATGGTDDDSDGGNGGNASVSSTPVYPIGPVVVPVFIPYGVYPATITLNPLWPAGTTFTITTENPGPLTVNTTDPVDKYTVNWIPTQTGNYVPPVLLFEVQPSNTAVSTNISPAVEVWVVGNLSVAITNVVFNIKLEIGTNPGSPTPGVLSGTTTVATSNGVATFSDLQIDQSGDGYTLIASVV
jgi:hypothetical protein